MAVRSIHLSDEDCLGGIEVGYLDYRLSHPLDIRLLPTGGTIPGTDTPARCQAT